MISSLVLILISKALINDHSTFVEVTSTFGHGTPLLSSHIIKIKTLQVTLT